jgi:hypothetical protein
MLRRATYTAYVCAAAAPLQNNFPEHLGCMFMINTPLLFRGFWSVIKGFLDERTLAKIKVGGAQAAGQFCCVSMQAAVLAGTGLGPW